MSTVKDDTADWLEQAFITCSAPLAAEVDQDNQLIKGGVVELNSLPGCNETIGNSSVESLNENSMRVSPREVVMSGKPPLMACIAGRATGKRDTDVSDEAPTPRTHMRDYMDNQRSGDIKTSKYRGIQWDKKGNRWRARLHTDRTRHVGYFESEEKAAMAWDQALLRHSMDKDAVKKLNFPVESLHRYHQMMNSKEQSADPNDYRGVSLTSDGKYRATVLHNRIQNLAGIYNSAEEAARAHDWKSISLHGWGTLTNFPIHLYETQYLRNGGISPLDGTELPPLPHGRRGFGVTAQIPRSSSLGQIQAMTPPMMQTPHSLLSQNADPYSRTFSAPNLDAVYSDMSLSDMQRMNSTGQIAQPYSSASSSRHGGIDMCLHRAKSTSEIEFLRNITGNAPNLSVSQHMPLRSGTTARLTPCASAFVDGVTKTDGGWKATVVMDLGLYESKNEADSVIKRARTLLRGHSSCSAEELRQIVNTGRSKTYTSKDIYERNGSYFSRLSIMNNPFEIGPFPTIQEAGYARDRYTLALQGPSACLNNPIIDIIIGEDDTNMLLSAISMIENPQNGPEVELKPQHEAMACTSNLPGTELDGWTPGLNSLHEDMYHTTDDLNRCLMDIETTLDSLQQDKRYASINLIQTEAQQTKKQKSESSGKNSVAESVGAAMAAAQGLGTQLSAPSSHTAR